MSSHASSSTVVCLGEQIVLEIDWELSGPAQRFAGEFQDNFLSADHRGAKIPSSPAPCGLAGKQIDSRRMSRVMKFVSEHIAGNFTVADLAGVACMSPAHF